MSSRNLRPKALILFAPGGAETPRWILRRQITLDFSGADHENARSICRIGNHLLPALAQQKDTANSQLAQQLEAIGMTSDEGFNKGDAAAIAASFTPDAVLVLENGPLYGRQAFEKWLEGLFQNVRIATI
jgi:hypothetical protein